MMFIGSRNWVSATTRIDGGFSPVIWFGPYRASRDAASALVNPIEGSDPNAVATSAAFRAYGGGAAASVSPVPTATSLLLTLLI